MKSVEEIQACFTVAQKLHVDGYYLEALHRYKRLLLLFPGSSSLLALIGAAYSQVSKHSDASRYFNHSLSIDSFHAPTHVNMGHLLRDQGELSRAGVCYRMGCAIDPGFGDAWKSWGLLIRGREDSHKVWSKLNQISPTDEVALLNMGLYFLDQGLATQSLMYFNRAIILSPLSVEAWTSLGKCFEMQGKLNEACRAYGMSCRIDVTDMGATINRAQILHRLNQHEEALKNLDRSITYLPDIAANYSNRGEILQRLNRSQESIVCCQRSILLQPDLSEAHLNLGAAFQSLGRYEQAGWAVRRVVCLAPSLSESWVSSSSIILAAGYIDRAIRYVERALLIDPAHPDAHTNRSLILLLRGNFTEGWIEAEWRWKSTLSSAFWRDMKAPLWLGGESLIGKSILVTSEQGLGDFIHFSRYLPLLVRKGARVFVECYPSLIRILSSLEGSYIWIPQGEKLPITDFYCPVMSLPLAFDTNFDTIPSEIPYLHSYPEDLRGWHKKLGKKTCPRVGLVWSGSSVFRNDHNRSVLFGELSPLISLPGIEFHILQKELRIIDRPLVDQCGNIRFHGEELDDFMDTAGLIQEMDLVISVDTSVAHLAGAMGKPVWILLPLVPDFRWLLGRMDSPWYPSATLYRQDMRGEWGAVISRIKTDLESFLLTQ